MKNKLLALALAAGGIHHAQAAKPGESQTLTSPGQVPQGLTAADWSSIRSARSAGYAANAAGVTSQQAYVKPSNTGAGDYFGNAVAVSGDTVVVGAFREDSSAVGVGGSPNEAAFDSGAAYVFVRSGGTWTQQAYLKASNVGVDAGFGSSVAIAGEIIVVGANSEDSATSGVNNSPAGTATNSGAAYVFVRNGGTWSQQAYLKASNAEEYDRFGESVAVSGETVVVGALFEDSSSVGPGSAQNNNSGLESGAAYVFTRSGSMWSQQAYLKASNTGPYDYFGYSVAVSGDTVVVGATGEASSTTGVDSSPNEGAIGSGAAYVFNRNAGIWSQQAYLKASKAQVGDNFGIAVAISGTTLMVGAASENSTSTGVNSVPDDGSGNINSGAAYLFTRSGAEPPVIPPAVDKTAPVIRVARTNPVSTKAKNVTLKGTASDASGIKSVRYRIGRGPLKLATGTTAWSFKLPLKKGLNTVTLIATDTAGNVSVSKVIKIKRK